MKTLPLVMTLLLQGCIMLWGFFGCVMPLPIFCMLLHALRMRWVNHGEEVFLEFLFLYKINLPVISRMIQVFRLRGSQSFPLNLNSVHIWEGREAKGCLWSQMHLHDAKWRIPSHGCPSAPRLLGLVPSPSPPSVTIRTRPVFAGPKRWPRWGGLSKVSFTHQTFLQKTLK